MKKLNELKKELEKFEESLRELINEKNMKQVEIGELKQEKKRYILDNWGDNRDQNQIKAFDFKIENLEKEVKSLEEQIVFIQTEKKNKFAQHIQEVKNERLKLIEESNSKIQELEKQLFEAKLKFMWELEKAAQQQRELQREVNEYHSTISQFERDSVQKLYQFQMYAPDYLLYGDSMKAPLSPTDKEIHRMVIGEDSPYRLPFALHVYKLTEGKEVIMNEKEARERFNDLKKGLK